MPRYIVHPGSIRSQHDRDLHFIGFIHLCRCYNIAPHLAVNADRRGGYGEQEGDIHLYPRSDGNYTLPDR